MSKLNKKNILLKESNNKMLYVSEVIKKSLEIFFFFFSFTYWSKSSYQMRFSGMDRNKWNEPKFRITWNGEVILSN